MKRTASEANRSRPAPSTSRRTVSQRVYDPSAALIDRPRAQINRLDPRDEEERAHSSEVVRDSDVLRYEDGLEDARQRIEDDEENVADELEAPLVPQAIGVELDALQDLVPETRALLRRNEYIRALVRCIQMAVWFKDQAEVRSHLLAAGLEVEKTDHLGRLLCSPALQEEKHLFDDKKLSEVEIEQRQREEDRAQEADVEYTLAQLSHKTGDMTFEEREEIEGIIEDALQVVVELERKEGLGLRISKWSVGVA